MYFGSVRFFRHLIVTALVLLILLPIAGLAVVSAGYVRTLSRLDRLEVAMEDYLQRQEASDQALQAAFDGLSDSVDDQLALLEPQISQTGETVSGQITGFEDKLDEILWRQQQLRQDVKNLMWELDQALQPTVSAEAEAGGD